MPRYVAAPATTLDVPLIIMSSEICKSPANPPQIAENSANILAPELRESAKKPTRKYDGRQQNGDASNFARISHWRKDLGRKQARKFLKQAEVIATLVDIFRGAYERKQYALCWQMIQDEKSRAFGKPFTAENPTIGAKPAAVHDQRLQVAINKFIVGNEAKGKRGKAVKTVQAKQLLEASVTTTPQAEQVAGE